MKLLKKLFSKKPKITEPIKHGKKQIYVTMGWDFNPITTEDCKHILSRSAEMLFNSKYYPTGKIGEWPCDPETGEKLPIEPFKP